jgi:hypothetical protein
MSAEHPLVTWTDRYGVTWACDAYDHGPFCRSCRCVEGQEIVDEAGRRLVERWKQEHGEEPAP